MRKSVWALIVSLLLITPALLAQNPSEPTDSEKSVWVEIRDPEEDLCRQECADDGMDPEECQMECNVVI